MRRRTGHFNARLFYRFVTPDYVPTSRRNWNPRSLWATTPKQYESTDKKGGLICTVYYERAIATPIKGLHTATQTV